MVADRPGDVYFFLDEDETPDGRYGGRGVPTGVVTFLTRCYAPDCVEGGSCYAYSCPRKVCGLSLTG